MEMPVIDVDTHYTEPADLWTSRAPQKYKNQVLHTRHNAAGRENWFIGDQFINTVGPDVISATGDKLTGSLSLGSLNDMAPAGHQAQARLQTMDKMGVTAALLYPNVIGFGAARLVKMTNDEELRLFHVRAYNDALADLQKEGKGRLYGQAALPLWDIEASLTELKRVREKLGLTGIAICDDPTIFGQPNYADPAWHRFFATCEDLQSPINFHVGSGERPNRMGLWSETRSQLNEHSSDWDSMEITYRGTQSFLSNIQDILNLILTGLLDRYPKLKWVSVESGVGWIPFVMQSLIYTIEELLKPSDRAKFKRSPKEMFVDQIYASYWFENETLVSAYLKEFGADNLMFETDYPHPQCLYPSIKPKIEETLGAQPADVQRKVLYENAAKLYGIKV